MKERIGRKGEEEEGEGGGGGRTKGEDMLFKDMALMTYFPQPGSTHFPPLFINGIKLSIHHWLRSRLNQSPLRDRIRSLGTMLFINYAFCGHFIYKS